MISSLHFVQFDYLSTMRRYFLQTTAMPALQEMPLLPTWRLNSLFGCTCLTTHCLLMAGEQTSPSAMDTLVSFTEHYLDIQSSLSINNIRGTPNLSLLVTTRRGNLILWASSTDSTAMNNSNYTQGFQVVWLYEFASASHQCCTFAFTTAIRNDMD